MHIHSLLHLRTTCIKMAELSPMFLLITFIGLLLQFSLVKGSQVDPEEPTSCGEYKYAPYTTVATTEDYEIRHYKYEAWLTVNQSTVQGPDKFTRMFDLLSKTFAENNITATEPVLIKFHNLSNVFYLPYFFLTENTTVDVVDDSVEFLEFDASFDVYVRSFDGEATVDNLSPAVQQLQDALHPESYYPNLYLLAKYNCSTQQGKHPNEIWMVKASS